jgi:hypothetical protein
MGNTPENRPGSTHTYEQYPGKTAPSPVQVLGNTALKGAAKGK